MLKLDSTFPRESIRWRAQSVSNGKALALAYIDARDVMERLDAVCGPSGWQSEHYDCGTGRVACKIGIFQKHGDYGNWVWKSDGAGATAFEADKGACSDAFKRAAVMWGIGRYLYDLGATWVPCAVNQQGKFKKFTADPWNYVKPKKGYDKLFGPLGKTELGKALRDFIGEVTSCEDEDQLLVLVENQKEVLEQCERDMPHWYFSSDKDGEHIVGLEERIELATQRVKENQT
jgi:hypothetical protein